VGCREGREEAVLPPQKIFDFFDIEMVHFGGFWVL
jgi:hypothetical protein